MRTYVEPMLTGDVVEQIISRGNARTRCCPPWGGRRRSTCTLDLATRRGVLERYGVEMIGATRDAIDKAEDRERFKSLR